METKASHKISVDIVRFFRIAVSDIRKMILYCFIGGVISIIVAFSIPRIYKSRTVLAPEESSSGFSGNISSLASMVGMNLKIGTSGDALYPEIYPDAIESTEFLVGLFGVKVTSKDSTIVDMPYSDYLKDHQKIAWWDYPMHLLSKQLNKIKSRKEGNSGNTQEINPFCLTRSQYELTKAISRNIECKVDKKTSVIEIEFTAQDPYVAWTMANAVTTQLQAFITSYRTNKAKNDEAYMQKLFKEAEDEYTEARLKYASFCESNTNVVLKSVESKMKELENDMDLKLNIYTQMAEQLQLARSKVQERTPAFTALQKASAPVKHANTPKLYILILFVFLSVLTRLTVLFCKNYKEIIIFNE